MIDMQPIMRMTEDNEITGNSCPLSGAGLKITWNSFASACLARQAKNNYSNKLCRVCSRATAIKEGKRVDPPNGITIIKANGWIERPIVYPRKTAFTNKVEANDFADEQETREPPMEYYVKLCLV